MEHVRIDGNAKEEEVMERIYIGPYVLCRYKEKAPQIHGEEGMEVYWAFQPCKFPGVGVTRYIAHIDRRRGGFIGRFSDGRPTAPFLNISKDEMAREMAEMEKEHAACIETLRTYYSDVKVQYGIVFVND